jgi:hypothetical protein
MRVRPMVGCARNSRDYTEGRGVTTTPVAHPYSWIAVQPAWLQIRCAGRVGSAKILPCCNPHSSEPWRLARFAADVILAIPTARFSLISPVFGNFPEGKDTPEPRMVQPPELGGVVELPEVGGLHHRYERRAA